MEQKGRGDYIKRVTIETAGPYVDVIVYPIAKGRPTKTERSQARHYTSEVRQKMNDRTAAQKFKRLIAANFTNQDFVVALTYHDAALPPTPEQAREKKLRPFIRDLRAAFRENGEELKYMYVTEGLHGDHRLHHHIILPNVPGLKRTVKELWKKNGENIGFDRLGSKGIDEWAGYLTKEPRKTGRRRLGDRMWTPSLGLKKPEVISYEVPDNYVYTPPDGVVITTNEEMRTEYVSVQYISYRIPEN